MEGQLVGRPLHPSYRRYFRNQVYSMDVPASACSELNDKEVETTLYR